MSNEEKNSNEKELEVQKAASILGRLRWKGVSKPLRSAAASAAALARFSGMTSEEKKKIASHAAKSISPENASKRAKKAWATRKKNAAKNN